MRLAIFFLAATAFAQSPIPIDPFQAIDARTGIALPCQGCQVFTYASNTTTPLTTYSDYTLSVPNTNPVLTNSAGYAVNGSTIVGIWPALNTCYKLVLKDANSVTIWTRNGLCDEASIVNARLTAFEAQLAATGFGNGANLVGFKQPASGASALTVQEKLQQTLNLFDFGAACNNAGDDSAAIAASLAALPGGGGSLIVPNGGNCRFASTQTLSSNQRLVGNGNGSQLTWNSAAGIAFDTVINSIGIEFRDLKMASSSGGTSTAIRLRMCGNGSLVHVYIGGTSGSGFGTGLQITGDQTAGHSSNNSVTTMITNTTFENFLTTGLLADHAVDTLLTNITFRGAINNTTSTAMVLDTGVSGFYANTISAVYGLHSYVFQNTNPNAVGGAGPLFLFLDHVLSDTTTGGHGWVGDTTLGENPISLFCTQCWAAAAGEDNTGAVITTLANGIEIDGGDGWNFSGSRIRRNANSGLRVNSPNVNYAVVDNSFIYSNNVGNNAGGHGIDIQSASPNIGIMGSTIGNVLDGGGNQKCGINVAAVLADQMRILGNDLNNNVTNPVCNLSTGYTAYSSNLPISILTTVGSGLFMNGKLALYNGVNVALGNGLASIPGSEANAAQSASISAAPLLTTPAAGTYRVFANLATSTAGSGNVTLSINYTDAYTTKTITMPLPLASGSVATSMPLTAGNASTSSFLAPIVSGSLTYTVTYAGTGAYTLYITAEQVQ